MKTLDHNNFEIFHSNKKTLTKEEILNLFYPYRNAFFYPEIQEHLMTGDSLVLLIINKVETVYDEKKEEDVKLETPIIRLKQLIGDKDPSEAKIKDANSLRAKYGVDLIKNGFYCSDDPKAANKERDVFLFPIPERPPEFKYIKTKVTL
jgi:nucleoside diphosphate kinase